LTSYVALLRGINVGGHSIMPMKELVAIFERLGLANVRTYIASGNVLFETANANPRTLEGKIEKALVKKYRGYNAKVIVRSEAEMQAVIDALPRGWRRPNPAVRYNVIFLRHNLDAKVLAQHFKPKPGAETLDHAKGVLYSSTKRSDLTRASIAKLGATPMYKDVTIRSLNTAKKLLALMRHSAN
jgi:uncharacterized protein (DUF1697 family)